jgi:hypothetical protein
MDGTQQRTAQRCRRLFTELSKPQGNTGSCLWKKWRVKGSQRTHGDSCLLKRTYQTGTVIICVYVDDCLLTGDRKAINSALDDIDSMFETRRLMNILDARL